MNRKKLGLSILLATTLLTGCHKNPLTINTERNNVRFLMEASLEASKTLNPAITGRAGFISYLSCMKEKTKTIDCPALYQAMADFGKHVTFGNFKDIRVTDLTDPLAFEKIEEAYEIKLFNTSSVNYK